MIRISLAESFERARLLAPARCWIYATRPVRLSGHNRKRTTAQGVAWQGWNPDPRMEAAQARLLGSGSFYWPCAFACVQAGKLAMRADVTIEQITIETISGVEVARLYRN